MDTMMNARLPIAKNGRIRLTSLAETQLPHSAVFTVTGLISNAEGASSVCYEARDENNHTGVLKEFYPLDVVLRRGEDNQLTCVEKDTGVFDRKKAEYAAPYQLMMNLKNETSDNAHRYSSFIPSMTLYAGCGEGGEKTGSTYVWLAIPSYVTFETICRRIREKPLDRPQYNLVLLIKLISELADCLCIMHTDGLAHRDIKPQNFGFQTRSEKLLEQTLSFFDLDSVYSFCSDETPDNVYSNGFSSPLVLNAGHIPRAADDFYAIGATLYYAVIISDDPAQSHVYTPGSGAQLAAQVASSLLVRECRKFASPRFEPLLVHILKKCLLPAENSSVAGYTSATELKNDLHSLLSLVTPPLLHKDGKVVWRGANKVMDNARAQEKARMAILNNLYRDPLYTYSDEEYIHVLLLGFGYYGQRFMDTCLQAGQLPGQTLRVTVVAQEKTEWENYLSERPELQHFFNVNGSLGDQDGYGRITFREQQLCFEHNADRTLNAEGFINAFIGHEDVHFVFAALGGDEINYRAAQCCGDLVKEHRRIHYACEAAPQEKGGGDFSPIYVCEEVRDSDLDRMAFNAHLVWNQREDSRISDLVQEFKDPYYRNSCRSFVLSLKNKLHGLGVEMKITPENTYARIAENFEKKINDDAVGQLHWLEHRRWVTEKICSGWKRPADLACCVKQGSHKNKDEKWHACICLSEANNQLRSKYFKNDKPLRDMWERGDLSDLDELDRLSVQLHRAYAAHAQQCKNETQTEFAGVIEQIDAAVKDVPPALRAWHEYFGCMRDVWEGRFNSIHLLDALRENFENEAKALTEKRDAVRRNLNTLDQLLAPMKVSAQYLDFKKEDVRFIEQIPFILTHDRKISLVIPYRWGDNTALFGNIAAALVIRPSGIVYLADVETRGELTQLCRSLPDLERLITRKHLDAQISFDVTCRKKMCRKKNDEAQLIEEVRRKVTEAGKDCIGKVTVKCVEDRDEMIAYRRKSLRKGARRPFALEKNDGRLSLLLQGAGVYQKPEHYAFDPVRMTFAKTKEKSIFSYIRKKPHLTAADILALCNSGADRQAFPEFCGNYAALWALSRRDRGFWWKKLCEQLKDHVKAQDRLAVFDLRNKGQQEEEYSCEISVRYREAAEKILDALIKNDAIDGTSSVEVNSMDTVRVRIIAWSGYRAQIDSIFADCSKWGSEKDITIENRFGRLEIYACSLAVRQFKPKETTNANLADQLKRLLQTLATSQYALVQNYVCSDDECSFTFTSRAARELLTSEGRMLEVYVYHRLKEGGFDDVVSSYEVKWGDTAVQNEFDCIATKNFSSLFIECKARAELDQEFYFKIACLAEQFGINAWAVLIADTQENTFQAERNAMQRQRGKMMQVVTIYEGQEIQDIDKTLGKVIEGTYSQK